ncbi:MAG: Gfo/Idh/MocA family oxidoreductase [Kiritimatiellia bacterium]|jgi:predicted dehydrogenase|nr:Gfo/Idh/MocA family oxidoreductase [Kiritimatiellia bacterium]
MKKPMISRRSFVKTGAAMASAPYIIPASVLGKEPGKEAASERVAIAAVGVGGRGNHNLSRLKNYGAEIVALCDVNKRHLETTQRRYGVDSKAVSGDFREIVTREDVDAVMVATNDHWHVLVGLEALKAGKDVYIEKPLGKNIGEGRALVNAVRKYKRLFMHGTEQRSFNSVRRVCELVRNGRVGKVEKVIIKCPGGVRSGPPKTEPVPEWLDYKMYQGPAPDNPYDSRRAHTHYHFHISDYCSSGFMAGWGVHHHDIFHWAMDLDDTGPLEIEGKAEFPPAGDLCDSPLTWNVDYTYAGGLKMEFVPGPDGVRFEGSDGWIHMKYGGGVHASRPEILASKIGENEIHLHDDGKGDDNATFVQCVKSRERTCSPEEPAQRSSTVGFLGVIACRLGRKLKWDPVKEQFKDDDEANTFVNPPMRAPWKLEV